MTFDIAEAIKGIRQVEAMIDFEEDFALVILAETRIKARNEENEKELKAAQRKQRAAAKALAEARKSATRPAGAPGAAQHTAALSALDEERLALVKAANEAETRLGAAKDDCARLREEVLALDARDEALGHALDGTPLRLEIVKGMGFEPITDKAGKVTKLLVRSRSGEVHVADVELDPATGEPAAPLAKTDLLWKLVAL